ncbi:MAG: DUF4177 domain-containing protein [FCB group bacterium]|jgi:hypothetical protein|nr:DUF4177 domain-containing protein [FCB group bacterium]
MGKRYEYTYARVKVRGSFFGGSFPKDYQRIIDDYAREGWRFVQAYAPATAGYGLSALCDLIFERETEG